MRKKLCILLVILLGVNFACFYVTAENMRWVSVVDSYNDQCYTIGISKNKVNIKSGSDEYTIDVQNVNSLCVYKGLITMFATNDTDTTVSQYDCRTDILNSFSVSVAALSDVNCFAADCKGNVYFADRMYSNLLIIGHKKGYDTHNFNEYIKQLICLEDENILVVTDKRAYIYSTSGISEQSIGTVNVPLRYLGNRMYKDNSGEIIIYKNKTLSFKTETLTTVETTISKTNENFSTSAEDEGNILPSQNKTEAYTPLQTNPQLQTDKPEIINGKYLIISQGTTVSKIKKNLADFNVKKITRFDGKILESGKVGTDTKILLSDNSELTVIIYGELTGEGNINTRDIKAILNHLSYKEALTGSSLIAADINKDGVITTKDALMLSAMF